MIDINQWIIKFKKKKEEESIDWSFFFDGWFIIRKLEKNIREWFYYYFNYCFIIDVLM